MSRPSVATSTKDVESNTAVNPVILWKDCIQRVYRDFKREVEKGPKAYVTAMCVAFLENRDKDQIMEKIIKLSKFHTRVDHYRDKIYSLEGVSPEYQSVSEIVSELSSTVRWAEELMCYAMVDPKDVKNRYAANEFAFQSGERR